MVGALASLCQRTDPYPSIRRMHLRRSNAIFPLGACLFSITNFSSHFEVQIIRGTGFSVAEMLAGQLQEILECYAQGFDFLLVVPSDGGSNQTGYANYSGVFVALGGPFGVAVRVERREGMMMMNEGTYSRQTAAQLRELFQPWLSQRGHEDR
jgi:hypothetical protein